MSDIQFPAGLKEITAFCRKSGIESLKIEGLEIKLREEAPPSNYKRKIESSPEVKAEPSLTEEDWLLWSVQQDSEVTHG